jgi:serine/threonine protein kinase
VDGSTFFSMEYVDGENLGSLLRRIGRLPGDKAVDIARRLCAGLAYLIDVLPGSCATAMRRARSPSVA